MMFKLQTPPLAPPLEGRGRATALSAVDVRLFKVDSINNSSFASAQLSWSSGVQEFLEFRRHVTPVFWGFQACSLSSATPVLPEFELCSLGLSKNSYHLRKLIYLIEVSHPKAEGLKRLQAGVKPL